MMKTDLQQDLLLGRRCNADKLHQWTEDKTYFITCTSCCVSVWRISYKYDDECNKKKWAET